jgi:aminoglycoside 6'-N-acetyltransferase I
MRPAAIAPSGWDAPGAGIWPEERLTPALPRRQVTVSDDGGTEHDMRIVDLADGSADIHQAAAGLLVSEFHEPRGWPTMALAEREVATVIRDGFARAMVDAGVLVGWVGGLPEYDGRVWELHPMVVQRERRRLGVGRALVAAFEDEARRRGAFTATLGTDDDAGMTSLSGADLYEDVPRHIAGLKDLGRHHPFLFYRRLGYVVTGVVPDANGPGRPDILMSKSLVRQRVESEGLR